MSLFKPAFRYAFNPPFLLQSNSISILDYHRVGGAESAIYGSSDIQDAEPIQGRYASNTPSRVQAIELMVCAELAKFGPDIRALLFIQLASFRKNYLVILVTELEFRFALVSLGDIPDSPTYGLMIEDIGWLNVQRIHGDEIIVQTKENLDQNQGGLPRGPLGGFGQFDLKLGADRYASDYGKFRRQLIAYRFKLETEVLRELYSYCW